MQIVEENIKKFKTKDGILFIDRWEAEKHEKAIPYGKYYQKLKLSTDFVVTENHLKLIKRNEIEFVFFKEGYNSGHFYQDIVRPYGNSNWIGDIAQILGIEEDMVNPKDREEKWFSDSLEFFLVCHHIDMMIVMEILCQNLSIKVGKYKRSSAYGGKWELVEK